MTRHLSLGAFALFSLIAVGMMLMSPPRGNPTGLFAEEHGDCTIIYGGVTAYRYCGPEVNPVSEIVYFPPTSTHTPFIPSDKQQYGSFDGPQQFPSLHELHRAPIRRRPGFTAGDALDSQQFDIEYRNARRSLLDEPYAGTPWEKRN